MYVVSPYFFRDDKIWRFSEIRQWPQNYKLIAIYFRFEKLTLLWEEIQCWMHYVELLS